MRLRYLQGKGPHTSLSCLSGLGSQAGKALQDRERGEGSQTSRNVEAAEFTPHFPGEDKEAQGEWFSQGRERVGNGEDIPSMPG